jgi:glycosyltransferase involved in cell wall biosynthesis
MAIIYKLLRYGFRLAIELVRLLFLAILITYYNLIKSKSSANTITKTKMIIGIAAYPHNIGKDNIPGGDMAVHAELARVLTKNGYIVKNIKFDRSVISSNSYMEWVIGIPYLYSTYLDKISDGYDIIICDSGVVWNLNDKKYINLFHFSYLEYAKDVSKIYDPLSKVKGIINGIIQVYGSKKTFNVAVSEYLKSKLSKSNIKIHQVISNGINLDIYKLLSESPLLKDILYIGGYSYYGKGLDIVKSLGEKGIKITCITNHEDTSWENIRFISPVPHEQTPSVYPNYSVVVYPSRFESCQMVPLESMACGTPVVISNVGIGPELQKVIPEFVVNGHNAASVREYEDKIKLILSNRTHYSKLARSFVENSFSLKKFETEWLKAMRRVYENII